jgi:hypothetical protein
MRLNGQALGQKQLDQKQLAKEKIGTGLARDKARVVSLTATLREKPRAARTGKLIRGGRAHRGTHGLSVRTCQSHRRRRALGRRSTSPTPRKAREKLRGARGALSPSGPTTAGKSVGSSERFARLTGV